MIAKLKVDGCGISDIEHSNSETTEIEFSQLLTYSLTLSLDKFLSSFCTNFSFDKLYIDKPSS